MKKTKSQLSGKLPTARSWIEATFQKRECIKFIPSQKDEHRCCCGQSFTYHVGLRADVGDRSEQWSSARNTMPSPTDAYGTIEFQGGPHPTKAQYVRLAYDTRPDLIVQLFTREWNLELPKLLITVQGGKANFDLQPKLKKVLRKGLLKAAKTTGAWIFTGGTNTGVTRQVGDALLLERSQRSGRVVSIGIAPWGIVENNHELIGHNRDVPCHSIATPRSKYAVLNNRHAYFLLVDNGTGGRYGAEIILRRKLEKYISNQKLHPYTHSSIPVVCLVIEGGTNTIRAVLEYVTDNPPVPVVVCDGSGRAADLIAFTHKYASETGEQKVLESMKEYLITTIQRTFEVSTEQAECLYGELLQCTRKKKLITIFRISERTDETCQELDQTILTALFKSQHLSPSEQLSLALTWNRVDIARSEIFIYGQEWPPGALDEAMMQALEHDRIDFVKLLLENGVSMKKFLTIPRLEELYNTKQGPSNTLGYILRDVRPHIPRGYMYTLHDIGLVINKLMGGAYRAYYTRRKFRPIYAKVMNKSPHVHRNSASFIRYYGNALSLVAEALPATKNMALFDYPFNELLIWSVLTKRQQMALLMWQHGEEALAKSLVACKLYKAMAHEAAEDDLETEIYEELRNYGKEFEAIALELLDFCYRQDDDQTQQLLTCELQNWSGQTCLSLAVAANHRALLAHPCSQIILADLWMGGLRTRKNTNIKVILGLLCPFYIVKLEFKSKEELQLMPQTEEEHLENESLNEEGKTEEKSLDGENKRTRSMSIRSKSSSQQGVKALIAGEAYSARDTIVQENGKVRPDCDEYKDLLHIPLDYYEIKQNRPLRLKKKLYEFYTAPITKFWANSIAYIVFLIIFSYSILVKMDPEPSWQEFFSIAYITTLGFEKIREIVSSEPVAISHKFAVWAWNMWNPCDAAAIIFFLIGLSLRLKPTTMDVGRVIYCVNSLYWYLRILNILGVNKYLGPLVTMMGKMVKNMIYFVVLLLVVLISFGVCRQSILYPHSDPGWYLVKEIFYQPYFMLYGEVFADSIDPACGDQPGMEPCQTGRWITPTVMSIYLLVANILLINLLIAVFNNIFNEVNAIAHQVWMFQRFTVVMEYEQKPVLPPPFIVLSHIFLLLKYLKRKVKGVRETYDNGLKLFLEKDDLERLYDFEEECVEGYFREKESKLQQSTEERIKITNERVENLYQKLEDIYLKENNHQTAIQGVEFRLRKIEEINEKNVQHLAVIHRFMATHIHDSDLPEMRHVGIVSERLRKSSEMTESTSDPETHHLHVLPTSMTRRRPTRSLTEVRPDAYIFDDGLHLEVRPLEEEDETVASDERFGDGAKSAPSRMKLAEKQRSSESRASIIEEEQHVGSPTDTGDGKEVRDQAMPMLLDEGTDDEGLTLETLKLTRPVQGLHKRRDSSGTGRRSSEGGGGLIDLSGHPAMTRRQLSQTHSEPDNSDIYGSYPQKASTLERGAAWVEPKIKVIPPPSVSAPGPSTSGRSMLLAMHAEYTSITDELETVCGLLSPPRTPRLLSPPRPSPGLPQTPTIRRKRHASEMSNPEMALYLEKEHLRDAEECDYLLMENLIQRRYDDPELIDNEQNDDAGQTKCYLNVVHENREFRNNNPRSSLRRSSAIEMGDIIAGSFSHQEYIFPVCSEEETDENSDTPLPHSSVSIERQTAKFDDGQQRQNSAETNQTSSSERMNSMPPPPPKPSIIMDSSQLPIQREIVAKADSKASLHMQSETMC